MTSTAHPNQRRSACERCRRQKLRCSRQDTDENRCSRCARLGVECVAGQQRRIGRPSQATATGRAKPATQSEDSQIISLKDAAAVGTAPPTGNESHASPTVDLDLGDEQSTASTTVTAHDASAFNPDVTIGALFDDIPWGDGMALETDPSASFANLEAQAGLVETHHRSAWIPARPPGIDPVVQHEALVKLSKLNLDLHSHLAKMAIDKERIDFCSFAHPASPLSVGGVTVTELGLIAFQEFVDVLAGLQKVCTVHRDNTTPCPTTPFRPALPWSSPGSHSDTLAPAMLLNAGTFPTLRETSVEPMQEKIDLALVTMIISCYAQIVALFEEIFYHIRNRLESLVSDPIEPIDGLKFGAFPIGDGHLQGLIFFQIITSLLLKAERLLGFPSPDFPPAMTDSRTELLSSDQSRLLRDQLTSRDGDHISRPTKLRGDVEHMQTILALGRAA